MRTLLLALLFFPSMLSCQTKKEFPDLINKEANYTDDDYKKEHFQEFLAYEFITTKNDKTPKTENAYKNEYPWNSLATEKQAKEVLNQIEKWIIAQADGFSEHTQSPSKTVVLNSLVDNLTEEELSEFKENGHIKSRTTVLDYIKAKVKSYELTNEKNEKITFTNDALRLILGGLENRDGKLLSTIGFETMGMEDYTYLKLKGFIAVELEIPIAYETEKITKNSVGKSIKIDDQRVDVLEFDGNVMHLKLINSDNENFSIYIDNCSQSYDGALIPESVYLKCRRNQGLSYEMFLEKYNELGWDNIGSAKDDNYVYILKSKSCRFENVFLYNPESADKVKKTIRVPVDIDIMK